IVCAVNPSTHALVTQAYRYYMLCSLAFDLEPETLMILYLRAKCTWQEFYNYWRMTGAFPGVDNT
ncbi:unnamed protein product, partial [marine sediment metagenome]